MEVHLKFLSNDDLLEKHLVSTCEYFCRMCSSQSSSSLSVRELSWMALARIIRKCKDDMLKKISSRIQKRVVDSASQPVTFGIAHFICAALEAFPCLKRINKNGLAKIMSHLIDFAVQSRQQDLIKIVSYAFSLYADESSEKILLLIANQTLSGNFGSERNAKFPLHFESCFYRENREKFISVIFEIISALLESHLPGFVISLDQWLYIARIALTQHSENLKNSVFEWIEKVILHGGLNVGPYGKQIMSLFMDFSLPSEAFYNSFRCFYLTLGPSSGTSSVLSFLLKTPAQPWWEQTYAESYVRAVHSVLTSKVHFLKPHEVINFQRMIGLDAFRKPKRHLIFRLFSALLSLDHELVPCPIQLAQSIFAPSFDGIDDYDELQFGRALCACISRPKAHLIPHFEKWVRKMDDIISTIKENKIDTTKKFVEMKSQYVDATIKEKSNDAIPIEETSEMPGGKKTALEPHLQVADMQLNKESDLAKNTSDEYSAACVTHGTQVETISKEKKEEIIVLNASETHSVSLPCRKSTEISPATNVDSETDMETSKNHNTAEKSTMNKYDNTTAGTVVRKRKLTDILDVDSSGCSDVSPIKKEQKVHISETTNMLKSESTKLMTPEEMMEDLIFD